MFHRIYTRNSIHPCSIHKSLAWRPTLYSDSAAWGVELRHEKGLGLLHQGEEVRHLAGGQLGQTLHGPG